MCLCCVSDVVGLFVMFCNVFVFSIDVWMVAFEQHDVQELCRVLFDALELTFKGTPQVQHHTILHTTITILPH